MKPLMGNTASSTSEIPSSSASLKEVEAWHIQRSLAFHEGNITHTSDDLGITPVTLRNKMKLYGI